MRRMLLAGLVVALTGALAVVAVTSVGAPPRTAGSGAPGPAAQPAQRGADSGPFAVAAERSRERGWGGSSEAEAEVASPAARDAPTGRRSLLGGRIVAQVTRDLADRLDVEEEQMRSALASVGRDTLSRGARDDRRRWPVLKDEALESLGRELDRSPGDVAAAARNELEAKLRLGVTFGAVSERGRDLALACFDAPQRCDLRAVRREVHGAR